MKNKKIKISAKDVFLQENPETQEKTLAELNKDDSDVNLEYGELVLAKRKIKIDGPEGPESNRHNKQDS